VPDNGERRRNEGAVPPTGESNDEETDSTLCIWYGYFGALCVSIWQVSVMLGHVAFPQNWTWVELAFSLHALAAMATFQRGAAWNSLFSVTPQRIVAAKMLLALATLNFLSRFSWFLLGVYRGTQDVSGQAVALVLTSFLFQTQPT